MNQQNNVGQQTTREEERVLGISYDRAIAMIPRLMREATGAEPEALGDGYLVARAVTETATREVTVRLGRQGADTRFSVRVETLSQLKLTMTVVVVAMLTLGLGVFVLIPWIISRQRKDARDRDLLVHKTFRAIEDAVAEQGVASNYRIAPGADAASPTRVAADEPEPSEEAVAEDARTSSRTR
jgi:hypothetical protein